MRPNMRPDLRPDLRLGAMLLLMAALGAAPAAGATRLGPDKAGREPSALSGAHNLQAGGAARAGTCGFCHTPEGTPGGAPQWTRGAPATAYAAFDSRGADGAIRVAGPSSVACLVCHDGVQAHEIATEAPRVSVGGQAGGSHPAGVPFKGDLLPGQADPTQQTRLQRETVGGQVSWWLDLERVPNGIRDKSDAILYVRAGDATAQPFVECATCHDPHGTTGRVMLRNPNAGSGLCLACHNL